MALSRKILLAGSSLLAVAIGMAQPRMASAAAAACGSLISTSVGACSWTTGDLSITNSGAISGGNAGITVNSSVGTLTNDGSISSGAYGVVNNGSITALTNNGSISGGVFNYGGIAAMSNSGMINAGSYGVNNTGSITTLGNSGMISAGGYGVHNAGTITTLTNSGTISSNRYGVQSYGSIGTLANSGAITGGYTGIINESRIGTLTNSGAITGGQQGVGIVNAYGGSIGTLTNSGGIAGVYNDGSIGAITNSGAISGNRYAILNGPFGTLGPITNSGVIAGDILNNTLASSVLVINGGSGSTFCSLTGVGGSAVGLIYSASTVAFGAGNLLLNDNIAAGTVTNSGATLKLINPVTISGSYNQTGGGLVVVTSASGASSGSLQVGGAASVANSAITISGAGLTAGQRFVVVHPGGAGSYTNDTASIVGTSGLIASLSGTGADLVVTLFDASSIYDGSFSTNLYTAMGNAGGGAAAGMGGALDAIAASNGPTAVAFQNSVLMSLAALPGSAQPAAIKSLAPSQVAAAQTSDGTANVALGAVGQHQATAMAYDAVSGVAAGSDGYAHGVWGQVLGGGALRGTTAAADGYRSKDVGLVSGLDYQPDADTGLGVALSWVKGWSSGIDDSAGNLTTTNSYQFTGYGQHRWGPAFIEGQLGVGYNTFDQRRVIGFLGQAAHASYDGEQYLAKAGLGYDVALGHAITVTPQGGLQFLRAVSDGYAESGAGNANLTIDRRGVQSLTQDLGGKVAWVVQTDLGRLKPEARLAWVHDYTQSPIAASGVMGGAVFTSTVARPTADGARVNLAATLESTGDVTLRAEYEGEVRHDYQSHTGLLKASWGF